MNKKSKLLEKTTSYLKTHKVAKTILSIIVVTSWVGLVYYLAQLVLANLIIWIFHPTSNSSALQSIYSVLCYLVSIAIIILVPWRLSKQKKLNLEELGIIELPTWGDIALAPIGFIVYLIFGAIITNIFSAFPWFNANETQNLGYNTGVLGADRYLILTVLVVVAPIAEEIIFRGFLYGKLRAKLVTEKGQSKKSKRKNLLGIIIATIITSVVFGIMHGQWNVGVNVFALSIVLCALREITGTIYAGILLHMLKNAVAFYFIFIAGLGF